MKIFYHNDMDGKCSAALVRMWRRSQGDNMPEDIECIPMQYGVEFPHEKIGEDEDVYIVDFSIEPDDYRTLREQTICVTWIDHHKTAIEKYSGEKRVINGLRRVGTAACELTWEYLYPGRKCPKFVRLIGDRDVWKWEFGEMTKYFHAGLLSRRTDPEAEVWRQLRIGYQQCSSQTINRIVEKGRAVSDYKQLSEQAYIKENGFWFQMWGYKCYGVNGRFSSEPFEVVVPGADVWVTFLYNPVTNLRMDKVSAISEGYWTVSLYSKTVDVSKIATGYLYKGKWGGGHKGAAGFQCAFPPFLSR